MANGLAGDTVRAITEDDAGRMYIGTTRGFNQLDLATNHISHFDVTDGLAGEIVHHCFKDRHGDIWFATNGGVSKFNPRVAPRARQPPIAYLIHARAAGRDLSLPERGTRAAALMSLEAARNNLQIEYVGLSFQDERSLKYQYKLEGVDKDWSAPTEQRAVNYASLAPGSYRFLVRAINREGMMSQEAAVLPFRILPPIWERWWFISLVMIALSIMLLALHRFRLRQVIAMERIRRQIATDLHDDVGSGLSQVAILSEVVKREASPASAELLNEVAGLARSMRESMSDIVWAVDPRKDSLFDLVQRLRQTAYNLFEADGLHVEFSVAESTS
jgi:signal transduction histidine kinase